MTGNKKYIFFFSAISVALIIFLAHLQYFKTREQIVELYGEKQTILSEQVALSVEKFFAERMSALEVISVSVYQDGINLTEFNRHLQGFFENFGGFEFLMLINRTGDILTSFPRNADYDFLKYRENRERVFNSFKQEKEIRSTKLCDIAIKKSENNIICLHIPIFDQNGKLSRVLIGVINLNNAITPLIVPLLEQMNFHTYIINSEGDVVYHSSHPEMLLRNINRALENACLDCHDNFQVEKRMLKEEMGWDIKTDRGGDKKLITFVKIDLPGINWSLAIDTPYKSIVEANRKQFWIFFLLTFTMILMVIAGGVYFWKSNKEKIEIEKESAFLKTRNKLLENIEEAEARYRTLVEQSPNAIGIIQNRKFIFVNKRFTRLFGYGFDEIIDDGFDFYKLVAPGSEEELSNDIRLFLKNHRNDFTFYMLGINKKGDTLDLEVSVRHLIINNRIAYQIVIHDVTDLKIREREDSQRRQLAFIGEMSTRIAHEIKNPLASLQAGIQLLQSNLPDEADTTEYFKRLKNEVQRVDTIVKGLLSYAKEEKLNIKSTNLGKLIAGVIENIKPGIKNTVVDWQIEDNLEGKPVKIDSMKIEQVFWNLLLNSIHAIHDSGKIKISLNRKKNESIFIKISDTGGGISPKNMDKIFQPFFSTKAQGTGLGLAVCRKIITAHHGDIEIHSIENKGTDVFIKLPENFYG